MACYRYGETLRETLDLVRNGMGREELVSLLEDGLYGTDNLRFDATEDEIREEAIRQVIREWQEHP